jgi:3-hydroxyisobutyrate dehydrogenase
VKIGWIGLGKIGSIMAANLLKAGYTMIVHDLTPEPGEGLVAAGAQWAKNPCELAEVADIVITSLPGPPQVKKVMESRRGVFSGLRSGCTWIDMSTTDAQELKRLAKIAASKGVAVLEAPVTGGLVLAKKGGITILVGGEKEVFEAHLPMFQVIGGKILLMGPLGSASVVKVISNLLSLGHMILAGEAFMLGKRAGIDLAALFEGIMASSGRSRVIRNEMPLVYNGTYDVGFSMALACKDLGLVLEMARKNGVPLELGALIEQIFIRAKTHYGDHADSTQVVKLIEDALGDYLRGEVVEYAPRNKNDF